MERFPQDIEQAEEEQRELGLLSGLSTQEILAAKEDALDQLNAAEHFIIIANQELDSRADGYSSPQDTLF